MWKSRRRWIGQKEAGGLVGEDEGGQKEAGGLVGEDGGGQEEQEEGRVVEGGMDHTGR
jgi:hypothetical protein